MPVWTKIKYLGFWDVPRNFLARHDGRLYLFDCPFDRDLDDYPDEYRVYLLPPLEDEDLPKDWTTLPARAIREIGIIPISEITFDPTKREKIDVSALTQLLASPVRASG